VLVRVWNETVSNLTLMALGSSAPEILLSVIEIVGNGFNAGELGPGTIVGSAAFNMFVIVGICIGVIPSPDTRRVKHIYVFWVTVVFSVLAYVWLYLIIAQFSENVVELWEALVTLAMFPVFVLVAWVADRQMFGLMGGTRYTSRAPTSFADRRLSLFGKRHSTHDGDEDPNAVEYNEHRQRYISIFKQLRAKHPDVSIEQLEQLAQKEALKSEPKSRAYYRVKTGRKMLGGGDIASDKRLARISAQSMHDGGVVLSVGNGMPDGVTVR